MKTQIITVEAHDDVFSIRDKMNWSKAPRILLVLPRREKVLKDKLDLVLLLRKSLSLGVQLAFVAHDPDVRYHAKALGIQVFDHVRQAQEARWSRTRLPKPMRPSSKKRTDFLSQPPTRLRSTDQLSQPVRLVFFTLGILALFSMAATIFPSAEVRLSPRNQVQEVVITIQASPNIERVRLTGVVPLRTITVVVEGQDSLTPTGIAYVPRENAKGKLLFTNLTDKTVIVPAGTIVSTLDLRVRFATQVTDYIPARPGQTAIIPATALTPGSRGNLSADRLQVIEGNLGAHLAVTNPQPTVGGSDVPVPAPTPLDRTRLSYKLLEALQRTALQEIHAKLETGDLLLTSKPLLKQTLEKTFQPPDEQPSNELTLTLRAEYEGKYIAIDDLTQLAEAILNANLPHGYVPIPQTLKIEGVRDFEMDESGIYHADMRFSRQIQAHIPKEQAVQWVLGATPAQAETSLMERLPLLERAQISLEPSWWPRLPLLPMRIHVRIP